MIYSSGGAGDGGRGWAAALIEFRPAVEWGVSGRSQAAGRAEEEAECSAGERETGSRSSDTRRLEDRQTAEKHLAAAVFVLNNATNSLALSASL